AVIYSSLSYWEEEMTPVYTTLVVFDRQGRRLSSMLFSCDCSAGRIKTGKIKNGHIEVEDWERSWESPIDKVPFDENRVSGYTSVTKATFVIDNDGMIREDRVPDNYTDTVHLARLEGGNK